MRRFSIWILIAAGFAVGGRVGAEASSGGVIPAPASAEARAVPLRLLAQWRAEVTGPDQDRINAALDRMRSRWSARAGADWRRDVPGRPLLEISAAGRAPAWPALGEDESYFLSVKSDQVVLQAPTSTGVLRGLATLEQLLQSDRVGWFLPGVAIRDRPRFAWRGLMIDVSRHWMPVDVIERTLDGMALVKLNVLHWHLTDDQGFRVDSHEFPHLTSAGSDGLFYTQPQIREIVAYAAARGIRVVPEFDLPGHTASWLVGYPELGSAPGPYAIERRWGIHDPVLDPTNEAVYRFLDRFLAEMTVLFPDAFLHIGGDEVKGRAWTANPSIQAFIQAHGLVDNAGLQAYFNRRLLALVAKRYRRMIGWDEIFHPDLPKDTVIESWRGPQALAGASRAGYSGILAYGYYLDYLRPAGVYYANDPLPPRSGLTPMEEQRILGGEAAMWSEFVSPETIDGRIWPAAAAVAERLWSPATVTDEADLYRRLAGVSRRLEEVGVRQEDYRGAMIRRLAGDAATPAELAALAGVIDILEAAGLHERHLADPLSDQFTPLTGLADCARPESPVARAFGYEVKQMLAASSGSRMAEIALLRRQLAAWSGDAARVSGPLAEHSVRIAQISPVFATTGQVCQVGIAALDVLAGAPATATNPALSSQLDLLKPSPVRIAILPSVQRLLAAAFPPARP